MNTGLPNTNDSLKFVNTVAIPKRLDNVSIVSIICLDSYLSVNIMIVDTIVVNK